MKTLAIDTSCDETSASVVDDLTVLSNVQPSQMEYHRKYGGIVPSLARLAHTERIDNVVTEALKLAQTKLSDLDAIAVTTGPGLAIALEVGIKKAKQLSKELQLPLYPINHMEGHLLSGFAQPNRATNLREDLTLIKRISNNAQYPILGVLVSGKHTEFIKVESFGEYAVIGETLDDACGEAFDKAGRMLGLGYPGGPIIAEFAESHRKQMKISIENRNQSSYVIGENKKTGVSYELPIAMAKSNDLNVSYSGLKTAFKQLIESVIKNDGLTKTQVLDLSVMFEQAAFAPICIKLKKAIQEFSPKEIWLGGGVVANNELKRNIRKIARAKNIELEYPRSKKLTTDNAAMIAMVANLRKSILNESGLLDAEKIDLIDRIPRQKLGRDY